METIVRLARCSVEDRLLELLGGKNDAGDTALLVAARHGHGETVEVLMKLAPELAAEVNGAAVTAVPGGDERVGAWLRRRRRRGAAAGVVLAADLVGGGRGGWRPVALVVALCFFYFWRKIVAEYFFFCTR